MLTLYSAEGKRVTKWYKYFFHLMNTCVFNSHIILQKLVGISKSQLEFREQLIYFLESKPVEQSRIRRRPSS